MHLILLKIFNAKFTHLYFLGRDFMLALITL